MPCSRLSLTRLRGLPIALPVSLVIALVIVLVTAGCGPEDPEPNGADGTETAARPGPVLDRYAELVLASYDASIEGVVALRSAIDAFLADPNDETLTAAREAWLAAREPYGQTEVYRFYAGPIDHEEGPEGQINAWPMDEVYVDAIIDDAAAYPELTPGVLASLNEKGGEKNISTGWHAVEYLLWGADTFEDGPGRRPATDFAEGTPGADRRAAYLRAAIALLETDLRAVADEWRPDADNYREAFLAAEPADALGRMLTGMGSLSGAELAGERMTVAYDTREQEDEHSCFSDNTHRDIVNNARGIQNVYLGRFGEEDGPGLDVLVEATDPDLARRLAAQLEASVAACEAIPAPFDRAIVDEEGRARIHAAITALQAQTDTIAEVASVLGIRLDFGGE